MSFDKTTYTVEEQQGAVDVTLNLDKLVPFADYTVDLEINDGTTCELYSVNVCIKRFSDIMRYCYM